MFLNKMNYLKKSLILTAVLGVFAVGVAVLPPNISFAASTPTQPLKVVGMAKFVLKGTVTSVTADTVTIHITNTSKNAKLFDNKDKAISVSSKTTITKSGKNILLKQIKSGDKVKVFGIFDKKTGDITVVRWIKVVQK